jgi:hypothetical protein
MRTMPRSSFLTFLGGAACLFAGLGSLNDCLNLEQSTTPRFIQAVLASACLAVLWAWFGSRRMIKSLIVFVIVQIFYFTLVSRATPPHRTLSVEEWRAGVLIHCVVALILVNAGYVLFITFFGMEGKRFFAAHTEIELASAIQRKLVPTVAIKAKGFEIYGLSRPSGAVGGDLFDIVQTKDAICAYLADVAGHGVPAGVLMSMVKSAVRTRVASIGAQCEGLLGTLNEVLTPLTDSNVYATFAVVVITGELRLQFALAGHLPLLHLQRHSGRLERCAIENLPIAMFSGAAFRTAEFECDPGDVVALVTDGLTEIFDRNGGELGLEYIERILIESGSSPLPEIANEIFRSAETFGKITDDRTLLLLRRG